MTPLVLRWIVLAPAMWISLAAVLWFGFRTIDVRFEIFASLVLVPALQAGALTWALTGRPRALPRLAPDIARLPFGATAAIVDAAVVIAGVLFWSSARIGFGVPVSLQIIWAATKAIAAGVFLLARRDARSTGRRIAAGVAAVAIGVSGFTTWLGALPSLMATLFGHMPLVLAYLVTYGLGLTAVVVLLLRLGRMWPANSSGRLLVECCVAGVIVAALVLVLNGFKHRVPLEPYRGAALFAASLAASALLFAGEMPATRDERS